jgi:hypothetical protein
MTFAVFYTGGAAMDEHELLALITTTKVDFGAKCKKFAGALAVELLKEALQRNEIVTSARDVYIETVPVEIDLLIPKRSAVARHGILYRPEDVSVAFEVKNSGSFGEDTIKQTGRAFGLIRTANPSIRCVYITLHERRGYKHMVTEENLKHPVFTLFWYKGSSEKNRTFEASGDFAKLIESLKTGYRSGVE